MSELNRSTTSNETERFRLSTKKPRPNISVDDIYQTFTEELTVMFLKEFHKNRRGGTRHNMSYEARVTLEPKLDTEKAGSLSGHGCSLPDLRTRVSLLELTWQKERTESTLCPLTITWMQTESYKI